jgi:hypothetical protein
MRRQPAARKPPLACHRCPPTIGSRSGDLAPPGGWWRQPWGQRRVKGASRRCAIGLRPTLDPRAGLPHRHHRSPGHPSGQHRRGVAPPGTPVPLLRPPLPWPARPAAPGRRPGGPGNRARHGPADSQAPAAPGGGWHRGPGGRHSNAARPARRSARRTPIDSRRPPAAGCTPLGRPPPCAAPRTG